MRPASQRAATEQGWSPGKWVWQPRNQTHADKTLSSSEAPPAKFLPRISTKILSKILPRFATKKRVIATYATKKKRWGKIVWSQCLGTFGNLWQSLDQSLVNCCNFWQMLAIYGTLWQLLTTFGKSWQFMATSSYFWLWAAITPVQNLTRPISSTFSESSGRQLSHGPILDICFFGQILRNERFMKSMGFLN